MKAYDLFYPCIAIFLFLTVNINGQSLSPQVFSNLGDAIETENDVVLSWTIGEPITQALTTQDFVLTQGFQQSENLMSSSYIEVEFNLEVAIYPNPAQDFLNIQTSEAEIVKIKVFDVLGQIKYHATLTAQHEIDLRAWESGTYFIQLIQENQAKAIYAFVHL